MQKPRGQLIGEQTVNLLECREVIKQGTKILFLTYNNNTNLDSNIHLIKPTNLTIRFSIQLTNTANMMKLHCMFHENCWQISYYNQQEIKSFAEN